MTKLRNISFGPCWDASGVRGWFGEGYWFHRLPLMKTWLKMDGSTRVAKTTTLNANSGNMPIESFYSMFGPKEYFPRCIWWNFLSGRTLNSVGLSGPGSKALLNAGLLTNDRPFMISFMSIKPDSKERVEEFAEFTKQLKRQLFSSSASGVMALQINLSCPNTGLDPDHLIHEAVDMLNIAAELEIPIVIKINIFAPTSAIKEIANHPTCDAICVTNAIPFGSLPDRIPWGEIFPNGSPLKARKHAFGGGGYSGPELLPLVCEFVREARAEGITKPFNVGGGIRSAQDVVRVVKEAGLRRRHDSIFFASAAMIRPWSVPGIIRQAHQSLG